MNKFHVIGLALGLSMAPAAVAQDGSEEDATFEVGGSCAALAYMSAPQLRAFVTAGFTDDLHSFCYPEEPSECSDYTPFLKGLGRFTTGDDGFHCSLALQL